MNNRHYQRTGKRDMYARLNRPERVKQLLIVWGIRGKRVNRVVTAAINRNTGKPHEHRREIARRLRHA